MTKEQMETKLSLLPLLTSCAVAYTTDEGYPQTQITFANPGGTGSITIGVDLDPSEAQLQDVATRLPLAAADRLAALAILLAPPLT